MKKFMLVILGAALVIIFCFFILLYLLQERGTVRTYIYCSNYSTPCFTGVYDGGYSSFVYQGGLFSDYYKKPAFKVVEFTEAVYKWQSPDYLVIYINAAANRREVVTIGGRRVTVDIRWIAGDPCETAFKPDAGYGLGLHCAKGERLPIF